MISYLLKNKKSPLVVPIFVVVACFFLIQLFMNNHVAANQSCDPDGNSCLEYKGVVRRERLESDSPDIMPLAENIVMSASAFVEDTSPGDDTGGAVRVRVWSRLNNIVEKFSSGDAPLETAQVWVDEVNIQFESPNNTSERDLFAITGANPPDDTDVSLPIVVYVIYDVIGLAGIETNFISAYVNGLFVGSITSSGLNSFNAIKTFRRTAFAEPISMDLHPSIPFTQADIEASNQINGSGIQAQFLYTLSGAVDPVGFPLRATARIRYAIILPPAETGGPPPVIIYETTEPAFLDFPMQEEREIFFPIIRRQK